MGNFQEDFATTVQEKPNGQAKKRQQTDGQRSVAFYTLGCKLNFSETSAAFLRKMASKK
jgi:hypothetical protein